MKYIFIISFAIFFVACSNSNSSIGKQLESIDSLVINFNESQTNNILKSVTTTDRTAIKKLAKFVNNKEAEIKQCKLDGNLMFYKEGVLASDVSFNYSDDVCHHFIQEINGVLISTVMSNEATDFLKSLNEEKSWY